MRTVDLIHRKRDGEELDGNEISYLIDSYTRGEIPDYQMSAFLMAVFFAGMTDREVTSLTECMIRSGATIDLSSVPGIKVDKHSTGGVGDKTSLVVAPLAAAAGVIVPMISGRALGHTGGTLDKLESIPGLRTDLGIDQIRSQLLEIGLCFIGQSDQVAPADGKLYALRDVTGTIESIPLIAASIMSKKLAIGASHLLLDVKVGSGAFMKNVDQARELAQTMVDIGRLAGLHTVAAITSMEQPLGRAVGNALEMAEAIAILHGEGPEDVSQLCYHEAAELLVMTGTAKSMSEAELRVEHAILSGAAVAKLAEVIAAQDGDARQIEYPELLPRAPVRAMLVAPRSGYIAGIEAERMGLASMQLGAGRFKKGEQIDHRTGFVLQAKMGDYRRAGEPLVEIHARSESEAASIQEAVLSCYTWSEAPVTLGPLIYDTIRP